MEYLGEYRRLVDMKKTAEWKASVYRVVRDFLKEVGLKSSYDMSFNNMMIAPNGVDVVLVDFEMADGKERLI